MVKPGGHILVSVKISSHGLSADEHARYDAGQLVVVDKEFQGRNYCAAVHPDAYVRDVLARGFEPIASLPPLATPTFDHGQDAYLFRSTGKLIEYCVPMLTPALRPSRIRP